MRWPLKWFRLARGPDRLGDRVNTALIPVGRGGDGSNVLRLGTVSLRLKVEWHARELHAWDQDLPPERASRRFARQSLDDTEAALERLFAACPDVDLIEMTVREPELERCGVLMTGSVCRKEFEACHPLSTAMRLRLVGVNYLLVDGRIQLLTASAPAPATHEICGLPGPGERQEGEPAALTRTESGKWN